MSQILRGQGRAKHGHKGFEHAQFTSTYEHDPPSHKFPAIAELPRWPVARKDYAEKTESPGAGVCA